MIGGNWHLMRSMSQDSSVKAAVLPKGTGRRVMRYAGPIRGAITAFVILVVISSLTSVATPLLLKHLIDDGVTPRRTSVVQWLAVAVGVLAVISAITTLFQRHFSARIGEGLIFNLRTEVFDHVLAQPIAFFTRAQTGALLTRLNTDVIGAQNAFTSVLSSVVSNGLSLVLILLAMASLSWQLTLAALALVPVFLIPARILGARIAALTGEQMNYNADMGTQLSERFNVGGALLVKLFGDPRRDSREYALKAGRVRDVGVKLAVEFEEVSFAYPAAGEVSLSSLGGEAAGDRGAGELVLDHVSFTAQPGELVALVGPSGSGKTTITALVARLFDPSAGAVRVGGVDLRQAKIADVRSAVGVVTQDAHLFHDTISANLRYARPDATDDQLQAALRAAHIWPLIERLPAGLDTVVGDRGHRLSGGERQRLAIARLLLKGPEVVVLDEATAHLDSESEVAVQQALDAALTGRTAIVVAHRLSTVRHADVILVVSEGRIVERGGHAELLARGGLYADLYETQFAQHPADEPVAPVGRS